VFSERALLHFWFQELLERSGFRFLVRRQSLIDFRHRRRADSRQLANFLTLYRGKPLNLSRIIRPDRRFQRLPRVPELFSIGIAFWRASSNAVCVSSF